jgi:uncharacterized protein YndB with AHSA1/START domain
MPAIDVSAEVEIAAAPADVAAVMFDPAREPEWMTAIKTVDAIDPALKPGARVRRTGSFLGREFAWTTEVTAVHFPHKLTLQIAEGPFTGAIDYSIARTATGSLARIRNVGEFGALGPLPASLITGPMRSAMAADLARLKAIVERPPA